MIVAGIKPMRFFLGNNHYQVLQSCEPVGPVQCSNGLKRQSLRPAEVALQISASGSVS